MSERRYLVTVQDYFDLRKNLNGEPGNDWAIEEIRDDVALLTRDNILHELDIQDMCGHEHADLINGLMAAAPMPPDARVLTREQVEELLDLEQACSMDSGFRRALKKRMNEIFGDDTKK